MSCVQAAGGEDVANSPSVRQLVFPKQFSLGKIFVYYPVNSEAGLLDARAVAAARGRFVGDAQGTLSLKLAKNARLYLFPSYKLIEDPLVLRKLDPNIFDCVAFETTAILVAINKTIEPISHLTGLQRLEMDAADLTDDDIKPIKALINLESLSLVGNQIHGTCFRDLASLTKLRSLNVTMNPLVPSAFVELAKFKNLEKLEISQCGVNDGALVALTQLANLRHLSIGQGQISSKGLNLVKDLKKLQYLAVNGTKLSVKDLCTLQGSSIAKLVLPDHQYSNQDMQALKKALPAVKFDIQGKSRPVDSDTQTIFGPIH